MITKPPRPRCGAQRFGRINRLTVWGSVLVIVRQPLPYSTSFTSSTRRGGVHYDPDHYMIFTVDLPLIFQIEEASKSGPASVCG